MSIEIFEDALAEFGIEKMEKIENQDFEIMIENLNILNEGDRVWSNDYSRTYEGNNRINLGYSLNRNLYEIDFRTKSINCIDKNIHLRFNKKQKLKK